jgi:hypothetical protein
MRSQLIDRISIDARLIAGHMFVSNSLTISDLSDINEQQSSTAAAARLVDIVVHQPSEVYDSFLNALRIYKNQVYISLAFEIEGITTSAY